MMWQDNRGVTLIELLVAMAITTLIGTLLLDLFTSTQARVLTALSRNDLQDRAERLLRFVSSDIAEAAYGTGGRPLTPTGPLALVRDSQPEDPLHTFSAAIQAEDRPGDNDRLTIVKGISFDPPLFVTEDTVEGSFRLHLNRRPNRSPGSTRELRPAPEAISHLVLFGRKLCYPILAGDQPLVLASPLEDEVPAGTEVLGVRAHSYQLDPHNGSNRLRRDDFTSRDILDDAVDGLQFQYLLSDGRLVDAPEDAAEIRAIRVSLLVRDLRVDRNYRNNYRYRLGNRTYGPFTDHFRRVPVSQTVEVKNHGLP